MRGYFYVIFHSIQHQLRCYFITSHKLKILMQQNGRNSTLISRQVFYSWRKCGILITACECFLGGNGCKKRENPFLKAVREILFMAKTAAVCRNFGQAEREVIR